MSRDIHLIVWKSQGEYPSCKVLDSIKDCATAAVGLNDLLTALQMRLSYRVSKSIHQGVQDPNNNNLHFPSTVAKTQA